MSDNKKEEWVEVKATVAENVWDKSKPIEGELIKVEHGVGPNASELYTLLTTDGEVAVWGSTTLDSKLAELYLHDQVRIEPLGKVKSKQGNREYWDFKVSYIEGDRIKTGNQEPLPEEPEEEPIDLDDIPFGK
jgi:hypothetical protein